jgi:hypothetical protein
LQQHLPLPEPVYPGAPRDQALHFFVCQLPIQPPRQARLP